MAISDKPAQNNTSYPFWWVKNNQFPLLNTSDRCGWLRKRIYWTIPGPFISVTSDIFWCEKFGALNEKVMLQEISPQVMFLSHLSLTACKQAQDKLIQKSWEMLENYKTIYNYPWKAGKETLWNEHAVLWTKQPSVGKVLSHLGIKMILILELS